MLITLLELEREPVEFDLDILPRSIDFGPEVEQMGALHVSGRADLLEEHRGPRETVEDIRVLGQYAGRVQISCARCLDPVEHAVGGKFDLLFRPVGTEDLSDDHSISTSETEIGYYQKSGLVLEEIVREQVLLSIPARTLCRQDCKGLCPRCGQNLNSGTCACETVPADPRWTALSDLRSRMKPE